jgi:hypothetical protein
MEWPNRATTTGVSPRDYRLAASILSRFCPSLLLQSPPGKIKEWCAFGNFNPEIEKKLFPHYNWFIYASPAIGRIYLMRKSFLILGIILILESCVTGKIEEPAYSVKMAEADFEVREYAPRIVAETTVSGDFADAPGIGFRRLADYIFGNNTTKTEIAMTAPVAQERQSEKIAMTAPVSQERIKDSSWLITFTMPSAYTIESLPKPNSDLVTIKQLPPAKFAVVKFSGFNKQKTVIEKTDSLRQWLRTKSINEKGAEPIYARYNPPWTPWFLRRNEILIELE